MIVISLKVISGGRGVISGGRGVISGGRGVFCRLTHVVGVNQ